MSTLLSIIKATDKKILLEPLGDSLMPKICHSACGSSINVFHVCDVVRKIPQESEDDLRISARNKLSFPLEEDYSYACSARPVSLKPDPPNQAKF